MLPLIFNIDVLQVWLPAKSEAFSYVASGDQHVLVVLNALNVFDISIN